MVFLSFSKFSPRRSDGDGLSCSPGLPYQLLGISGGQHSLSWEKERSVVLDERLCDEVRPTQTVTIESGCKMARF